MTRATRRRILCIRSSVTILVLSASCLLCANNRPAEPNELVLGIISTEASSQLRKGFDPFIEALSKKLEIPIKAYFATDYAGVIEAMRFNKIQVAWMGNKSAIEAVDRSHAEVFAQITKADGTKGYHSVIIVNQESPFQSIAHLLQQSDELVFGNGDPNSTSGFLIPSFHLWAPHGIDPQRAFKRTRNANHEVNCLAVAMQQVDFAATNDEALHRFALSRPKLAERLRVIWKSPTIPADPMVWRKDLPRETKAKIKAAILSFGRLGPERGKELAILADIQDGWGPFLDSNNIQLLPIREIAVEEEIQSIRNDDRIGESKKSEILAELETEKRELQSLRAAVALLADGSLDKND